MASINDFPTKQNNDLLRDFCGPSLSLVALPSAELEGMKVYENWLIEKLPRCRLSSAFVVRKYSEAAPECWARWDYRYYRKAYLIFLNAYYPSYALKLESNFQIDHLEPRYRFSSGDDYFVRLHLVRTSINASYGAGFERNFFKTERNKSVRGVIYMSWIAYCKARGLALPGKRAGTQAWNECAKERAKEFAKDSGENESSARDGLLQMLQLGYTKFYWGEPKVLDTVAHIHEFE